MPRLHGCRGAAMYMDVMYVVCAGAHKRRCTRLQDVGGRATQEQLPRSTQTTMYTAAWTMSHARNYHGMQRSGYLHD